MAHLIILQAATLRHYLEVFRGKLNSAQWKHFVTVLKGLVHCKGSKTLSGMLRKLAAGVTLSWLSRFLISPAWSASESENIRCQQFVQQVQPMVAQVPGGGRSDPYPTRLAERLGCLL